MRSNPRRSSPSEKETAEALRVAARAVDRVWATTCSEDPHGAIDGWRGLVNGEWRLVAAFDCDDRRFLVAQRTPANWVEAAALSQREREVLALRARLHGIKMIAHQLRISTATVSRELRAAMRKLGVTCAMDLVSLVRGDGQSS